MPRRRSSKWRRWPSAGSELVRITVNSPEAAAQVARIKERLRAMDVGVPLVGDFHFNGHRLADASSPTAHRRSTSTASTRATWAAARSATSSSR